MNAMDMTQEEKALFEKAFEEVVDATATVLEKPEHANPKVQNLVMMELVGHVILSIQKAGRNLPTETHRQALTDLLLNYLEFISRAVENGGNLPGLPKQDEFDLSKFISKTIN